jgi:hypothetical protein
MTICEAPRDSTCAAGQEPMAQCSERASHQSSLVQPLIVLTAPLPRPIPSCVAVLGRHRPIIQSQFKTQSESIQSHDGRRKLAKHNNHRLRTRKIPKKSHFDEESSAINLQPKTFAECTQVPVKRATLNTDGRGCVARSPDKGTTERHRNTHQTSF